MRLVTSTILAVLATCLIADNVFAIDIPVSARERVERQCLPTQHREGADAFRQCVTSEIARIGDASPERLDALELDEQFLIQSTCSSASDEGCTIEQLESLAAEPKVSLAALSSDERLVLSNSCLVSNNNAGVVAYRRCVRDQVTQLDSVPEPAVGALGLLERNALELTCGGETTDLLSYRQCLIEMVGVAANTASMTDTGSSSADGSSVGESQAQPFDTQDNDSINASEVATSDYLDLGAGALTPPDEDELPTNDGQTGTQNEAEAASTDLPSTSQTEPDSTASTGFAQLIGDASARLTTTLQSLDRVGQLVLAAAFVLPLLLVGLWALMRSRDNEDEDEDEDEDDFQYENATPDHHHEPDLGLSEDRYDDDGTFDDFEAPARTDATHLAGASASVDEAQPATKIARPLSTADRGAQQPSIERVVDVDLDDNMTRLAPKPELDLSEHKHKVTGLAWHSAFGEWLSKQPPHSRLQSVIELFIYWMAYGDDRYDEQMRQAVMSAAEPDSHDLIKRWVLESDAYALSDAISWMQSSSSRAERCQTLDLLMTLLVTDGAMTPVQNTLLRFLTDAFGLGEAELDLQYSRAFGEPMPALPRVDKPTWWAQQDQVRMERWDARGLLLRPNEEQFRIRLGLSLTGQLEHQDINDAYRRAARRCQPGRFDALGQRELALVKRQLGKLNEAREGLLGVNA